MKSDYNTSIQCSEQDDQDFAVIMKKTKTEECIGNEDNQYFVAQGSYPDLVNSDEEDIEGLGSVY